MTAHIVPAAITALVAALVDRAELGGVQVDDGPSLQQDVPDVIAVGVGAQGLSVGTGATTHRLGQLEEQFDLQVAIDSATGESHPEAVAECRTRVYELFDVLVDVLERDRTLGGAVMTAAIGTHNYQARRDDDGTGALIEVTVRLHGFRRRR